MKEKVQKQRIVTWQKEDRAGNVTAFATVDVRAPDGDANRLWVRYLGDTYEDCVLMKYPGTGTFQVRLPDGREVWVIEYAVSWGKPWEPNG